MTELSESVRFFHAKACQALERLAGLALPGAKLTLLVRRPECHDGSRDMVITDDSLESVIAALEIRRAEELAGADKVIQPSADSEAT